MLGVPAEREKEAKKKAEQEKEEERITAEAAPKSEAEQESPTDNAEENVPQEETTQSEKSTDESEQKPQGETEQEEERQEDGAESADSGRGTEGVSEQAVEPKPIGKGVFGNIYDQFKGKAKEAIAFLRKLKSGEAIAALHHKDVGDISIVWGNKKAGLEKILQKHPEVVDNLQKIIDEMEIVEESDNRIKLESPTHMAVVSKEFEGTPRDKWLLTAYEKKGVSDESMDIDSEPNKGKQNDTATPQNTTLENKGTKKSEKSNEAKQEEANAPEGSKKFSLKDKPVRFEAGKKFTADEKKEVLATLKDAYRENGVSYHIEESASGRERRVYEATADDYVKSDITGQPLRYYITLPDGRVAHPTEVYPNVSDRDIRSAVAEQSLLDKEVDDTVKRAVVSISDKRKALDILNQVQSLQHETRDIGYGLYHPASYGYKTGIFTSSVSQAIDYVMRREKDVPAELILEVKKAVADCSGMVDDMIDYLSRDKSNSKQDNQGNPLNADGTLKLERVKSVDELTDEDFEKPTRNVELPPIPENVDKAIGAEGKPVIIKKNIFEKNRDAHKFPFAESRSILKAALYGTELVGQTQPNKKPLHWVAIKIDEKSPLVVLEVNSTKDNVEIIGWYTLDERNLERIKRQAERNGGELVMLHPKGKVESLSTPHSDLPSENKVTKKNEKSNTVFGKGSISKVHDEIVYKNPKTTPEQEALLGETNPRQYPTERELSENKGTKKSEKSNKAKQEEAEKKISLPTHKDWTTYKRKDGTWVNVVGNPKDGYVVRYYGDDETAAKNKEQWSIGEASMTADDLFDGGKYADLSVFDAYNEMSAQEIGERLYDTMMGGKQLREAEKIVSEATAKNSKAYRNEDTSEDLNFQFIGEKGAAAADIEKVNERFNEELDSFTMEDADSHEFDLGRPSAELVAAGVADKPIRLHGSKLAKKMKLHGFSTAELKGLPLAMQHPIAVFDNRQSNSNRSVLVELKTKDGNFLVTIDLGKGTETDFDIVSTVFGKRDDSIVNWINRGYLNYVDKEKALAFLHLSAPIAEASEKSRLSSATKIVENFENPSIEEDKKAADLHEHKAKATATSEGAVSERERTLRDVVIAWLRKIGIPVIADESVQAVLDEVNGAMLERKRALETVSVSRDEEHQQTVISSADGAKVLKELDNLVSEYEYYVT